MEQMRNDWFALQEPGLDAEKYSELVNRYNRALLLMMRRYRITRFTAAACGMVLGGFIGNFAERLLFGYVRDMIFFPWLPWFVCNVADIFICFGVAALAFSLIFRPQDWQEK